MTSARSKLFLIHWNQAEAESLARGLILSGWDVEYEANDGRRAYESIKADLPAAIVIYLSRLPSHGRETADALRAHKATREVPVVFVGGQGEPLEKTKAKVPGAIYTTEAELSSVLQEASGQ